MHQFTSQGHHLTECITKNTVSHRRGKGSIWTDYHLQSWHRALVHTETLNLILSLNHRSLVHGNLVLTGKRSPPHAMKARLVIVWLSLYNVTKINPWLVRVRCSHSWNPGPLQHVTPCVSDRAWAEALTLQQWEPEQLQCESNGWGSLTRAPGGAVQLRVHGQRMYVASQLWEEKSVMKM